MGENLKTTRYNDSTKIPLVTDKTTWSYLSTPAYCWYNNDSVQFKYNGYGAIYNWYTVNTGKLAPKGWHVPAENEWNELITYLGGNAVAGGKLKEAGLSNWINPNTGATNETNFNALPSAGRGNNDATFEGIGTISYWWTATQQTSVYSRFVSVGYDNATVGQSGSQQINGLAVRCIKNTTPVLTTIAPTSILSASAMSGGIISFDGGETVTEYGVCWNTTSTPTIADSKKSMGSGTGSFTGSITGLTPNTTYYLRAYATNSLGTAYGEQISFKTLATDPPTVTDIDGNVYRTVTIGTQTWMAENLKTTKYNDGTQIPLVTDKATWANLSTPAYCWYNNDSQFKYNGYGAIYNWYTVNTGKLAPMGWHVPTENEWNELITYLGGNAVAGGKLKEAGLSNWINPNTGATNETNFSALPSAGRGNNDATFEGIGIISYWWTATPQTTVYSRFVSVAYNSAGVGQSGSQRINGLAVRCIKNTTPVLTTATPTSILSTSALCGGNITFDGGDTVTDCGVCWSTLFSPTIIDSKKTIATVGGTFSGSITGLSPNTTYYLRAYATNSIGTVYGAQVSFKTQF